MTHIVLMIMSNIKKNVKTFVKGKRGEEIGRKSRHNDLLYPCQDLGQGQGQGQGQGPLLMLVHILVHDHDHDQNLELPPRHQAHKVRENTQGIGYTYH